jgi:hypothetical protein
VDGLCADEDMDKSFDDDDDDDDDVVVDGNEIVAVAAD